MSTTEALQIPGLASGTWAIDASHSSVGFTVRHLMISKVRGKFDKFEGAIEVSDDLLTSTVTASVVMSSINTNDEKRDAHLRSPDFFNTDEFPTMDFRSTGLRLDDGDYLLDGELTLHGVTKAITFQLEANGVNGDPWGGTRAGFTATGEISRNDYGIDISMPMDGGGVVVGEKVKIELEIEAVRQA
jgi:polyisoprenoid-binding protein YceI